MYNILTLNKIADCGADQLSADMFRVSSDENAPDAILLRSADIHSYETPAGLLAVGRAGAGVNNIPVDKYAEKGIVVFNTPGANANAVKELVIAALMLSSRKIDAGINWVQSLAGQSGVAKLIEAGKGQFAGPEISGKKLGVIGLGAVGVLVANACNSLGMEVYGFDPFLSVDAAWRLSRGVHKALGVDAILAECDYITIHVPLNAETRGMINTDALAKVKSGVRILNFSRGELVDNAAIKDAVQTGIVGCYLTDFPNEELLGVDGIIPIPHLGASTPESEDNCAVMAAEEIREYLLCGAIKNSVNFPDCDLPYTDKKRLCVLHKNIPHVVARLTAEVADRGVNIDYMINRSKGVNAYTVIDVDENELIGIEDKLHRVEGVIRVRVI
ncbi:MAG: 3-phosphoglycerate dehydrogenase [Clostridiales bacterium]|jgi:D-3-phosphoglycerate dehydrogenase|nr:3-phosphoglycerate dehydrogenase [Clostridiales bacterium]